MYLKDRTPGGLGGDNCESLKSEGGLRWGGMERDRLTLIMAIHSDQSR